jgi:hypothetical protein
MAWLIKRERFNLDPHNLELLKNTVGHAALGPAILARLNTVSFTERWEVAPFAALLGYKLDRRASRGGSRCLSIPHWPARSFVPAKLLAHL